MIRSHAFKKMICSIKRNISIKRIILSISVVLALSLAINCMVVMAAGSNFQLPSFLDRYDVYSGGSTYTPNYDDYPFNKSNTTAIGFDSLYGSMKPLFKYKGEVPNSIANEEWAEKYRTYDGEMIDGRPRPWSRTSSITEDNLKPTNRDPHIWSMTVSNAWLELGAIGLALVSGFNWIFSMLIKLMITLKSFNIAGLVEAMDSSGNLSKQISSIFLINPDTGAMSPFLIFSIFAFVISFIGLSMRVIRGRASARNVASEFGFFVLALLISGMYFSTNNALKLSKVGIDFMTSLSNALTVSANDSTSIFLYSSGDAYADNSSTQHALISKNYIDQLINAQFGVPVDGLYIINPDGSDGNFGTKAEVQEAMKETFGAEATAESMSVVTDVNGSIKINNLGYWLWAANSGVAIYDGTGQTSPAFYNSGNQTLVRTGSSDRMLYAIDFLSNIRAIHKAKGEAGDAIVNKVDKIMNNLTTPNYYKAINNVIGVMIQNLTLAYAIISVSIFAVIGQMIITFGSYCMVIMPALLLFNGTRSTANKIKWSYLLGFLRYTIGTALFNSIIVISTLLSQQGIVGMLVSAVICILLGKFGPELIRGINMYITQLGRGKELRFMSNVYHGMDRILNKYSYSSRKRNAGERSTISEKVESTFEKVQEGIKKGENPFKRKDKKSEVDESNQSKSEDFDGHIESSNENIDISAESGGRRNIVQYEDEGINSNSSGLNDVILDDNEEPIKIDNFELSNKTKNNIRNIIPQCEDGDDSSNDTSIHQNDNGKIENPQKPITINNKEFDNDYGSNEKINLNNSNNLKLSNDAEELAKTNSRQQNHSNTTANITESQSSPKNPKVNIKMDRANVELNNERYKNIAGGLNNSRESINNETLENIRNPKSKMSNQQSLNSKLNNTSNSRPDKNSMKNAKNKVDNIESKQIHGNPTSGLISSDEIKIDNKANRRNYVESRAKLSNSNDDKNSNAKQTRYAESNEITPIINENSKGKIKLNRSEISKSKEIYTNSEINNQKNAKVNERIEKMDRINSSIQLRNSKIENSNNLEKPVGIENNNNVEKETIKSSKIKIKEKIKLNKKINPIKNSKNLSDDGSEKRIQIGLNRNINNSSMKSGQTHVDGTIENANFEIENPIERRELNNHGVIS